MGRGQENGAHDGGWKMNTIKDFKALLIEFELNSRPSYNLGIPNVAHPPYTSRIT